MADVLVTCEIRYGPEDVPYVFLQVNWDSEVSSPYARIVARYTTDDITYYYPVLGSTKERAGAGLQTLTDPQAPFDLDITYVAQGSPDAHDEGSWVDLEWDGTSVSSVISFPSMGEVHILSGTSRLFPTIGFIQEDNGVPRSSAYRGSLIEVQRRKRPVSIWDIRVSESGSLVLRGGPKEIHQLRELIGSGAPILSRHGHAQSHGQPSREIISPQEVTYERYDDVETRATINFIEADEPEPEKIATVGTFGDIQASIADVVTPVGGKYLMGDIGSYFVNLGLTNFEDIAGFDWWSEANA